MSQNLRRLQELVALSFLEMVLELVIFSLYLKALCIDSSSNKASVLELKKYREISVVDAWR